MNKKNDKNNNFATFAAATGNNIVELDAKFFDQIGGGISGEFEGPIVKG